VANAHLESAAKFGEEGLAHEQKTSLAARIAVLLCVLVRVIGERADRRNGSRTTTTYDRKETKDHEHSRRYAC